MRVRNIQISDSRARAAPRIVCQRAPGLRKEMTAVMTVPVRVSARTICCKDSSLMRSGRLSETVETTPVATPSMSISMYSVLEARL